MASKAPCNVYITQTRHKDQPYTVAIHRAGKAEPIKLQQRYVSEKSARRGALRSLRATTKNGMTIQEFGYTTQLPWYYKGQLIVIHVKRTARK